MDIDKLVSEQKEIDRVLKIVKLLNKKNNDYLNNKKNKSLEEQNIEEELNQQGKKWVTNFVVMILLAILILCFETIGVISALVSAILGVLCFGEIILFTKRTYIQVMILKEILFHSKTFDDVKNKRIYEQLCESRQFYHQLSKEHERNLSTLSSEEYQEYLKEVHEYQNFVDRIINEEAKENKVSEDTTVENNDKITKDTKEVKKYARK